MMVIVRLEKQRGPIAPIAPAPRLAPRDVGHTDWHNDYQSIVLDLEDRLRNAADKKGRSVILRRFKKPSMGKSVEANSTGGKPC